MIHLKQFHSTRLPFSFVSGIVLFLVLSAGVLPAPASADDSYIRGYAAAVLEREFNIPARSVDVQDGVIRLNLSSVEKEKHGTVVSELLRIQGVARVEITGEEEKDRRETVVSGQREEAEPEVTAQGKTGDYMKKSRGTRREKLFAPLIADALWPHFEFAFQFYGDDQNFRNTFAPVFGEMMPLYREGSVTEGFWQIAAFGTAAILHDLDTSSWDLVNTDYRFGVALTFRKNDLSGVARVFHQSSHIGDEYLLNNTVQRNNFSFEASDFILSYDLKEWLRVYGGGGYMFSPDPNDLDPIFVQYGAEYYSPKTFFSGRVRPIAAVDIQNWEMYDWGGHISLRGGVQLESPNTLLNKINILVGYYNGKSQRGQFYQESDDYYHLGAQYEF